MASTVRSFLLAPKTMTAGSPRRCLAAGACLLLDARVFRHSFRIPFLPRIAPSRAYPKGMRGNSMDSRAFGLQILAARDKRTCQLGHGSRFRALCTGERTIKSHPPAIRPGPMPVEMRRDKRLEDRTSAGRSFLS